MKICKLENCEKKHKAKGYCLFHYDKWRRKTSPVNSKRNRNKICKLEHCEESHHCKGYCHLHYKRSLSGVNMDQPKQIKQPGKICSVEGCRRKHNSKNMCSLHRSRVINGVPMQQKIQEKNGNQGCSIVGCHNKHHCHGYCTNHWQRIERTRIKKKIVNQFGGKCHDCNNVFPFYVFDFDNIEETSGHIAISKLLNKRASEEVIQEELNRCQLVCANCHRIRTFTRYSDLVEKRYDKRR